LKPVPVNQVNMLLNLTNTVLSIFSISESLPAHVKKGFILLLPTGAYFLSLE
jgi:hypothetical protein